MMRSGKAHRFANFANGSHNGVRLNTLIVQVMSIIILILCVFGWLGQALHDGANIK